MNNIEYIYAAGIAFIIIFITIFLLTLIIKSSLIISFRRKYHVDSYALPFRCKISISFKKCENHYKLNYPYWRFSNRDNTRDKRRTNNKIICENSILYYQDRIIKADTPLQMIRLVNNLRRNNKNIEISLCAEENHKKIVLEKELYEKTHLNNINAIYNYYKTNPFGFEKFTAGYFKNENYSVTLTPKTNDGGYDVILEKDDQTSIVECKCYSPDHKIGRPAIQKLVGANTVAKADNMVFVTTSDFSQEAIEYATSTGVILINGIAFSEMISKQNQREQNTELNTADIQLTAKDLRRYYPPDYPDFI